MWICGKVKTAIGKSTCKFKYSVEFRSLYNQKKEVPKGSIEMYVEVFDAISARITLCSISQSQGQRGTSFVWSSGGVRASLWVRKMPWG